MIDRIICAGCAVNTPWEHRCHAGTCQCLKCERAESYALELENELIELRERLKFLTCLEDAGVDNWSGYDYAMELMNE